MGATLHHELKHESNNNNNNDSNNNNNIDQEKHLHFIESMMEISKNERYSYRMAIDDFSFETPELVEMTPIYSSAIVRNDQGEESLLKNNNDANTKDIAVITEDTEHIEFQLSLT